MLLLAACSSEPGQSEMRDAVIKSEGFWRGTNVTAADVQIEKRACEKWPSDQYLCTMRLVITRDGENRASDWIKAWFSKGSGEWRFVPENVEEPSTATAPVATAQDRP